MQENISIIWGTLGTCLLGLGVVVVIVSRFWKENVAVFIELLLCIIVISFARRDRSVILYRSLSTRFSIHRWRSIIIYSDEWQYTNPILGRIPM